MIDWWNSLSLIMKVLWGVTLGASLIFVIQSIMTFLGADAGGDFDMDAGGMDMDTSGADADISGDGASHGGSGLLSFRNFINFLLGFGWTAILMGSKIKSTTVLIILAVLVGAGLVVAVMFLFKWLSGMQQSGNIDVFKAAAGCNGTVYLTIPGERKGQSKIQITINNAVREYNAVTDSDTLKTGTRITVVEVIDADTMLVEGQESRII